MKCGDVHSKDIWKELNPNGPAVEITLIEVLSTAAPLPTTRKGKIELHPVPVEFMENVLCVAVDVAWWGGQTGSGKKDTRTETIAYTSRVRGKWSAISLERIDLNPSYNPKADPYTPNSDPDASILAKGIKSILTSQKQVERVVVGVDMPILAIDAGMPRPKKANERGGVGGQNRQCDSEWIRQRAASAKGWKHVNIFAGAPVVPRVGALVNELRKLDFEVFGLCDSDHQRIVFECFPNEVVWSTGVLGFAEGFTLDSLQLYKRLGKKRIPLPEDVFAGIWRHTVEASFACAGIDDDTRLSWVDKIKQWLADDGVFDEKTGIGFTGKRFDDAIDSVLSLAAVVGFVNGNAHIHQGLDPEDGHIIGPGTMVMAQNGK